MIQKILLFFVISFYATDSFSVAQNLKFINSQPVICLDDLLKIRKDITYIALSDVVELYPKKSPFVNDGILSEDGLIVIPKNFIVSIPDGQAYSHGGLVIVDGNYVKDLLWQLIQEGKLNPSVDIKSLAEPERVHGKVAVIPQGGMFNYYHWMVEVLPRLALLQQSGIDYDYLYLPLNCPFAKETIKLLGIDTSKLLKISNNNFYIQADELIVPSTVSAFGYCSQFTIDFLRNTFIPLAQNSVDAGKFSKRVFISRRNAKSRKIMNEDHIFALFKKHDFVRYELEKLSVLEQVALFHNAEFVVGEHGAGLTNIMFMQPGTHVVEIFQARERAMYWYLGQELGLQYSCVKTIEFDADKIGNVHSIIPLDPVKDIIAQLFNCKNCSKK